MQLVPPDKLCDVWPKCEAWIYDAITHGPGDENVLDVLIAIARGYYALWFEEQFAAVVQIVQFPRQKVATILYAGGCLEAMRVKWPEALKYCRDNGIKVLRVHGRNGWERAFEMKRVGVILQVQV